jgi:hypothetical protein
MVDEDGTSEGIDEGHDANRINLNQWTQSCLQNGVFSCVPIEASLQ